jgi:hypothetical protein
MIYQNNSTTSVVTQRLRTHSIVREHILYNSITLVVTQRLQQRRRLACVISGGGHVLHLHGQRAERAAEHEDNGRLLHAGCLCAVAARVLCV